MTALLLLLGAHAYALAVVADVNVVVSVLAVAVGRFGGLVVPLRDTGGIERRLPLAQAPHLELVEGGELLEIDDALLVQLEHGEEADDRLQAVRRVGDELTERH